MASQRIATKLYVPRPRPGLVERPRLLDRLGTGSAARLTLVSAPPGFGKTTLLAEWARNARAGRRPVAWLSLDSTDADATTFWSYVVAALNAVLPVGVLPDADAAGHLPTEAVITTLINALAARDEEVWLVLDDFHVIEGRDVHEGLARLIDRLPPTAHVLIGTRRDPDLPLSRWRGRGELVEVRAADLRFSGDETAEYLRAAAGLDLTPSDAATLGERTEGWIAALQLAALSLQGRDDARGFIERFAGDDRYIVDYLMDEVLAQQPADVREFLFATALLDRLTGPLCDAVTRATNGAEMLARLDRANLFIVALDDHQTWFRYHHLFADVLRARLRAEAPERVPELHRLAGAWFELNGLPDEAVGHALAAGDVDRAVHLIELALPSTRRNREDALIMRWLRVLPSDAVRRSPVLTVFYGWTRLASGDLDGAAESLDHADGVLAALPPGTPPPGADTDELRTLPAMIAIYRASIAQARGDAAGTAAQARRAWALAGPGDHHVRGGAAGFLALTAWSAGDITVACATFADAVASLRMAGSRVDELSSTALLADMWLVAGRPSRARTLADAALVEADGLGPAASRASADLHVQLSVLDLEAGDLAAAERHLDAATSLADDASPSESRYRWFRAAGRLAAARGVPDRALALLTRAEERYVPGFYPNTQPLGAMKARVRIAVGEWDAAAAWADAQGLAVADDVSYLREYEHLTLVRLLLAEQPPRPGALDDALRLLGRLDDAAGGSGRAGSVLEIRALRALALWLDGRRAPALDAFADAVAGAPEPDAYARLFLDEGEPMLDLLRDAARAGVASGHAGRLLALAAPDGEPPSRTPPGTLTERELQVLRLLDSDLSGPDLARTLFVSPNTWSTHLKHIFAKLGVTSRREAIRRARERGLL